MCRKKKFVFEVYLTKKKKKNSKKVFIISSIQKKTTNYQPRYNFWEKNYKKFTFHRHQLEF